LVLFERARTTLGGSNVYSIGPVFTYNVGEADLTAPISRPSLATMHVHGLATPQRPARRQCRRRDTCQPVGSCHGSYKRMKWLAAGSKLMFLYKVYLKISLNCNYKFFIIFVYKK
jgi:hypothetical protein